MDKLWRDMSDAEKGALLLAKNEGKVIEFKNDADTLDWKVAVPRFFSWCYYRVKQEPKVETEQVTIVNCDGCYIGKGTVITINGKPDPTSIKMEAL